MFYGVMLLKMANMLNLENMQSFQIKTESMSAEFSRHDQGLVRP
jgi:hypothetical protein